MKTLNPAEFGLNSRTDVRDMEDGTIAIVKMIKSRIIRKDAEKIVQMVRKIQNKKPEMEVMLICSPNICSKSKALLVEENIGLRIEEKFI